MRRPIGQTYYFILGKVGDVEKLSLKKRFCLAFLLWGTKLKKKDLVEFVELATEWRKTEREVGGPRTLLERRARRLFPQVKKWKAKANQQKAVREIGKRTAAEGRGVHSPEQKAKRLEANREMVRKRMESGVVQAHWWVLYPPDGGPPIKVYNLTAWCRENGLDRRTLGNTAMNPWWVETSHGWRAEKWNPLWDKVSSDYLPDPEETWASGVPEAEYPTRL